VKSALFRRRERGRNDAGWSGTVRRRRGSVVLVRVLVRVGMAAATVMARPGFLAFATLTIVVVAALAALVVVAALGLDPPAAATGLADSVVGVDGAFREPFALVHTGAGTAAVPAMVMHHGVLAAATGGSVGAAAAPVMRTAGADQQGQRRDEDQRMDNSHGGPP
jgi:hypothetical protein